jgi:hypothetical protein
MDVFVIPVAPDRYELYCESAAAVELNGDAAPQSLLARWGQRITAILKSVEQKYHCRDVTREPRGWWARTQDRAAAWVVERMAEQRLLWNLRGQSIVQAIHPADMSPDDVRTIIHGNLQHESARHRRWMIVDGIAFVLTFVLLGPLFLLVPGVANLPAAYFGFRVVGHWFSMAGARQGIRHVTWTSCPCAALTELREAVEMEPVARVQRVHAIAGRLRLQHLSTFFERMVAVSGA